MKCNFTKASQSFTKFRMLFFPGTFCSETNNLDAVEIDLDTRHLLTNMVQQATRVVSAAVEIASNSCNNGKHQLSRSASFLAMPPPNVPVKHHTVRPQFASFLAPKSFGSAGLELLSITAAGLPIVSPDLSGSGKPLLAVHDFDLEADKDDSSLSFDQCVDIIDTCLLRGDFSDVSERFRKKTKIEG